MVGRLGGGEWFMGQLPIVAESANPDLQPLRIGFLNQENSPAGSFPEARAAAEAAVRWVNQELGGVNGRPIELEVCITDFTVEKSQACAQQMVMAGVVAVTTGIDVGSTGSIPIFEENEIPVIGGIPANMVDMASPLAFYFSGGVPGGYAGFIGHAVEHFGASRIVLAHGEFESFTVSARDYGAAVATALGMEVELIPFPLFTFDFLPVLTKAAEFEPDAVVVAAADLSCAPIMKTMIDLGIDAQLYLVGACAAEEILEVAGNAADSVLFNGENPLEVTLEGTIYEEVIEQYATEPAGGVGTVSMRGFLNLYALLSELGSEADSREALLALIRSAVDRPSFWGHPYTCDGQQVPGLPALCAPQQTIFSIAEGELVPAHEGWIDTPALFAQLG
ncbi:MAG: ABC transporter substrate-binding protein [Actinomycetota bacterium]|nr:ABC transporter substrate-binding protein [Actinomycetota bacterium]